MKIPKHYEIKLVRKRLSRFRWGRRWEGFVDGEPLGWTSYRRFNRRCAQMHMDDIRRFDEFVEGLL